MCAESRVQSPSSALLCVDWAGRSVANPRTVIQSSVIAVASWCPNRKETELRRYRFYPRTHRLRCFVFFLSFHPASRCALPTKSILAVVPLFPPNTQYFDSYRKLGAARLESGVFDFVGRKSKTTAENSWCVGVFREGKRASECVAQSDKIARRGPAATGSGFSF